MSGFNPPAFPFVHPNSSSTSVSPGMTLRDWFAGQALSGILASEEQALPVKWAEGAYKVADAMLKVREGL